MMKKSLIALAVLAASGTAFAATSNVDIYGQARLSLTSVDGAEYSMADQASRIGLKGSEDLGGGMKASYHWENKLSFATGFLNNSGSQRLANVSIESGLGKLQIGSIYLPYKLVGTASLVEDTAADMVGTVISSSTDAAVTGINYTSPTFSGVHAAIGLTNGNGKSSAALVYANGPLTASVAKQDITNTTDATKFNIGYAMGDLTVKLTSEDQAGVKTNVIGATYAMGPVTLLANYADTDNAQGTRTVVGAVYSLSKRTNVVAAYADDKAGAVQDAITVQLNHAF